MLTLLLALFPGLALASDQEKRLVPVVSVDFLQWVRTSLEIGGAEAEAALREIRKDPDVVKFCEGIFSEWIKELSQDEIEDLCAVFYTFPMLVVEVESILTALECVRTRQKNPRLADIAIVPEQRTVFLMGGGRSLERFVQSREFVHTDPLGKKVSHRNHGWMYHVISDSFSSIGAISRRHSFDHDFLFGGSGDDVWMAWNDIFAMLLPELSEWNFLPMPTPGRPMFPWFSVRDRKWKKPTPPGSYRLSTDPLLSPKTFLGEPTGALLLEHVECRYPRSRSKYHSIPPIFVSHAFDFEDMVHIENDGGLLWPEFQVSWKVPAHVGDCLFLVDSASFLYGLKPTGKKMLFSLYETDMDSDSSKYSSLQRYEKAINHELSGNLEWWNGDDEDISSEDGGWGRRTLQDNLLITGTAIDDLGYSKSDLTPIKSWGTFWNKMSALVNAWSGLEAAGGDPYWYGSDAEYYNNFVDRDEGPFFQYPYMEAKIRGLVTLDGLVACLYPRDKEREIEAFLDRMGFVGWRIPVDWSGPGHREQTRRYTQETRGEWASAMTSAILHFAREGYKQVPWDRVPKGLQTTRVKSSNSFVWSPVAAYKPEFDYEYGSRILWRSGYLFREDYR
jgi:hypothetical protein